MRPSTRDRRTFLRQSGALGSIAGIAGFAGCTGDLPAVDATGTDGAEGPAAVGVDLRQGMELGVSFTAFGGVASASEVDPDEPGGGRLVRLDAVEPGAQVTVSWRQTVERERTPTPVTVGVGEDTPTPAVEVVEESGTVRARGLDDAHSTYLPMFWDPGADTTDSSAIWLSQEAFRELRETRETAWSADALTRITWVGKDVQERIHEGVETVDEVVLEAAPDFVDFDLTLDGNPTTVSVIRAHDSFGNEYLVVAEEANPLVVEFTYNAVSVGVTGFDTALWSLIKAVFSGYRIVSLDTP